MPPHTLPASTLILSPLKTASFLFGSFALAIVITGCNLEEPKKSETEKQASSAAVASSESQKAAVGTTLSLPRKATTSAPSAPVAAQTGQKVVHQKILKAFVTCIKNKESDCVCQYMTERGCKSYPTPGDGDWWYILIPSHFQRDSDSDLLDDITNPAFGPTDGKPFVQYRLRTSEEQTNEASFVYEDGAWKLGGIGD